MHSALALRLAPMMLLSLVASSAQALRPVDPASACERINDPELRDQWIRQLSAGRRLQWVRLLGRWRQLQRVRLLEKAVRHVRPLHLPAVPLGVTSIRRSTCSAEGGPVRRPGMIFALRKDRSGNEVLRNVCST